MRTLTDHITVEDTQKFMKLPEGWRWIAIDERVKSGDYLIDLRAADPCEILYGWNKQTEKHHAVATLRAKKR